AVEGEGLGLRQLQLDVDVVAIALGRSIDLAGVDVVGPRLDTEAEALPGGVFPGIGAQVGERDLTLAAVELGALAEVGRVALAGIVGELVEDAAARAVDRARA